MSRTALYPRRDLDRVPSGGRHPSASGLRLDMVAAATRGAASTGPHAAATIAALSLAQRHRTHRSKLTLHVDFLPFFKSRPPLSFPTETRGFCWVRGAVPTRQLLHFRHIILRLRNAVRWSCLAWLTAQRGK